MVPLNKALPDLAVAFFKIKSAYRTTQNAALCKCSLLCQRNHAWVSLADKMRFQSFPAFCKSNIVLCHFQRFSSRFKITQPPDARSYAQAGIIKICSPSYNVESDEDRSIVPLTVAVHLLDNFLVVCSCMYLYISFKRASPPRCLRASLTSSFQVIPSISSAMI